MSAKPWMTLFPVDSHDAIIDPEEWEKVQLELARRKSSTRHTQCNSPFSGKLICGDCGEIFGSKVWHSNSKYRRVIWRCNAKYEEGKYCGTPHLYEDDLKQYFVAALSELLDFTAIDTECASILQELDVVAGTIKHLVDENATQAQSQAAYIGQYNSLVERYENLHSRYDTLQQQKERRQIQADAIGGCLFALGELDLLEVNFSEALWNTLIDHVTVYADERLVFCFKNGSEITVQK